MSKSIATIERNLKETLEPFVSRPIRYGGERKAQPDIPYIVMQYLTHVRVGHSYVHYFDAGQDLDEISVIPSEVTFSFLFVGGNARGELSLFIDRFWEYECNYALSDNGIAYLRETGIIDLSEAIGGDMEQRAQSDITFSANIVIDRGIITTIEQVKIAQNMYNNVGNLIYSADIDVKP